MREDSLRRVRTDYWSFLRQLGADSSREQIGSGARLQAEGDFSASASPSRRALGGQAAKARAISQDTRYMSLVGGQENKENKTENELSLKFRFRLMRLSGYRHRKDLVYDRNGSCSCLRS